MGFIRNVGDAINNATKIFNSPIFSIPDEGDDQFKLIRDSYADGQIQDAYIDSVGKVPGTNSIFNPWKIFRYSGFGTNRSDYKWELHLDSSYSDLSGPANNGSLSKKVDTILAGPISSGLDESNPDTNAKTQNLRPYYENRKIVENPTASQIIKWAENNADNSRPGNGSPVPYTSSDFLWCKYYGKVPNNRLLTLRRYPIPVEDNIYMASSKMPLIPIAQAVTWYGSDIGNDLKTVLPLNWGFNWDPIETDVQDVTGNEISVDDVLDVAGVSNQKTRERLKSTIFSGNENIDMLKLSGFDKKLQQYVKESYGANGPYWNRVLGPINVINSTLIRKRGFTNQPDVMLKFEFSLRTFGGVNPKIAFLDLLSNMMSLTHNTAPFWGGGLRYFEQTGVTLPGLMFDDLFAKGDYSGALKQGIEELSSLASENLEELKNFVSKINAGAEFGDPTKAETYESDKLKQAESEMAGRFSQNASEVNVITKFLAPKMESLLKMPLIYRAALDGRAVGEWHLTVGNPMNPIAMVGNLCVADTKLEIGETLGLDDFPTEFTFTVRLKHGRPRAKQDIESMFNLGVNTGLGFTRISQPSSASNSYGERNTLTREFFDKDNVKELGGFGDTGIGQSLEDAKNAAGISDATGEGVPQLVNPNLVDSYSRIWKQRVSTMYGSGFGNSSVLPDYFKELKTKD